MENIRFDFNRSTKPELRWKLSIHENSSVEYKDGKIFVLESANDVRQWAIVDADRGSVIDQCASLPNSDADIKYELDRSTLSVVAQDSKDGSRKWVSRMRQADSAGGQGAYVWGVLFATNSVYVVGGAVAAFDHNGYILRLDAQTGEMLWTFATTGSVYHTPTLASDKVYVGDDKNNLYCLSNTPKSVLGECLWRYKLDGIISGFGTQGIVDDERVYWPDDKGHLNAIDAQTGDLCWRFRTNDVSKPPCFVHSWLFCSGGRYIYGLDRCKGALRWKFWIDESTTSNNSSKNTPKVTLKTFGGRLYAHCNQGALYCFDLSNIS